MIEIRDLNAGYPGKDVLTQVNLTIQAGQITAIVGRNGCGKSTLMKVLGGMIRPSSGQIFIGGKNISDYSPKNLAKTVSFLPQNRNIPEITAEHMVLHGRFPYLTYPCNYRETDKQIASACLEKMGLTEIQHQPLCKLSGGTRQKVYIAMALAQDTDIILMDEPTTFLDIAHQFQVMNYARSLANCGKTVVTVLHDLSAALQTADIIAVMDEGKIVACGNADEIYQNRCLESVFSIKIGRFRTESGWQYYYERG